MLVICREATQCCAGSKGLGSPPPPRSQWIRPVHTKPILLRFQIFPLQKFAFSSKTIHRLHRFRVDGTWKRGLSLCLWSWSLLITYNTHHYSMGTYNTHHYFLICTVKFERIACFDVVTNRINKIRNGYRKHKTYLFMKETLDFSSTCSLLPEEDAIVCRTQKLLVTHEGALLTYFTWRAGKTLSMHDNSSLWC